MNRPAEPSDWLYTGSSRGIVILGAFGSVIIHWLFA